MNRRVELENPQMIIEAIAYARGEGPGASLAAMSETSKNAAELGARRAISYLQGERLKEVQNFPAIPPDPSEWRSITEIDGHDGVVLEGWGEYRERDGFQQAFMRWYDSVGDWTVNGMPFYPTHWRPLSNGPSTGALK